MDKDDGLQYGMSHILSHRLTKHGTKLEILGRFLPNKDIFFIDPEGIFVDPASQQLYSNYIDNNSVGSHNEKLKRAASLGYKKPAVDDNQSTEADVEDITSSEELQDKAIEQKPKSPEYILLRDMVDQEIYPEYSTIDEKEIINLDIVYF